MPNCELCKEYVARRKSIYDAESDDKYMLCNECYKNNCLDDPKNANVREMCNKMNVMMQKDKKKRSPIKSLKRSVEKYAPKVKRSVEKYGSKLMNILSSLEPETINALVSLVPDENIKKYITSDNIGLIKNLNQAIKNNNKSEINKDIRKVSEKFQNMTN